MREPIRSRALACAALLMASALVHGQNPTAPASTSQTSTSQTSEPAPVFRATSRLVLLDVVATDHHGAFVRGLKAGDFTVLEDGKPQKISAFSVHVTPATPKQASPPLQLPPHQYANFTSVAQQSDRPVTIVLLDMLNTSGQDQQFSRKQMIQFLKALPQGRPVALFTLTSQLHMVQGFTADSDALVKAATVILTKAPLLFGSEASTQQDEFVALSMGGGHGNDSGPTGQAPAPIGQALLASLASQDNFQKLERMGMTVDALEVLARAVAGYSGRKNLLWLSAEFPVTFGPDLGPANQASQPINSDVGAGGAGVGKNPQLHDLQSEAPALQQTAALLAAAQVAVYPISVSGVVNLGTAIDISTSTQNITMADLQQETQKASQRQTSALWDIHEAMTDIARETGGEAFYGTNDIKNAMVHGMEEGSNYYTLAYRPSSVNWNGEYRKIEVKATASGARLTYRRGYYAVPTQPFSGDGATASMAIAMKFSVPELTMLFLKAQVLPPDEKNKSVRIDYAVDAHDLAFTDGPDQRKHAAVDFVASAWDKDLKLAAHANDTMNTTLRPEAYQEVMRTGLPFHQELHLKPGNYTLRLGVLDRGNQKIGTVDVPLTVAGSPGSGAGKASQ
jgi:VWFA-related protein